MKTNENANAHYSAGNPLVEFFSKAGSLFEKKGSFYGNEASALDLFYNAWAVDKTKAFKLVLWCRDARAGAGNRSGSRKILNWLAQKEPAWVSQNLDLIPKYGRWDDLISVMGTPVEDSALELWGTAIQAGDGLACKWSPRENKSNKETAKKIRKYLGLSPKDYRKTLAKGTTVVETQMCNKNWNEIQYGNVPSVAMSRYGKAFGKNDSDRFVKFLEDVKDPDSTEKVNAGALFPHDLMKQIRGTEYGWSPSYNKSDLADAQFEAMPDFFSTDMRVMSLVDMSGSMTTQVAGNTTAMDIAIGLSLYASDRLGKENPFYRKVIPYSTDAKFYSWQKASGFSEGVIGLTAGRHYMGATNICAAFDLMLETASFMNITNDQMPNTILIVSDMQFHQGVSGSETEVEGHLKKWDIAGFDRPNVIFWNTAGYAGSPADVFTPNTGLVSGFSPSILNAVFNGDDFTPLGIMERTIEKYEINVPSL